MVMPIIPLNARKENSQRPIEYSPPVNKRSSIINTMLNTPLRKVIPTNGTTLPMRSNVIVPNAQEQADNNADNMPKKAIT